MSRIFGRGELKEAIVMVLASLGEVHGYGILNELKERVGGGWKPSPGAIYPALVALVESGHIATIERDGSRLYSLTERGRRAAESVGSASRWSILSDRAGTSDPRISVGILLDRFADESPLRRRLAGTEQRREIESILARTAVEIGQSLTEGDGDG
jgi:DNA-binding PadR family transcriptional regulator